MNRKIIFVGNVAAILICAVAAILICASLLRAGTVTFVDDALNPDHWNFPGYNFGDYDENDAPEIDSITVGWSDSSGYLEEITVNFRDRDNFRFDSLFINVDYKPNADGSLNLDSLDNWDYFVHTRTAASGTGGYTDGTIPTTQGLYEVIDEESYIYTTVWTNGRNGHPNGIDLGSLNLIDNAIERQTDVSPTTFVYDFRGYSIELTENFSVAYTSSCANDVIWGPDPVPEPATMLLFGAGLTGLAGLRRKKR